MTRTTVIACAVLALSSAALAQEWSKEEQESGVQHQQFRRVVPSGAKRMLESNLGALNTDCTPIEGYEVKVTTPPQHGTAEVLAVQTFSTYAKDNVRSKCNTQRTPGLVLTYQSAKDFHGENAFDVEVLLPSGHMRQVHYVITVR